MKDFGTEKKWIKSMKAETKRKFNVDTSSDENDETVSALGEVDDDDPCHFELNAETVDRAIALYELLTVKSAGLTIHTRNDKTRELVPFVRHYSKDPMAIYQLPSPRRKYERIAASFEIVRSFPTLDRLSITS
jgi:hypothetical protein